MGAFGLGLVIALVIILVAAIAAWAWVRIKIDEFEDARGPLPGSLPVDSIGYQKGYLPRALPDPKKFDPQLAAFALRACQSATNHRLGSDPHLPDGVSVAGWAGRAGPKSKGRALLAQVGGGGRAAPVRIVAVSGTLTYGDLRADFDDQLGDFYGTKVHKGFLDVFNKTYPGVRSFYLSDPQASYIVTGHSLGASVATLVAAALALEFPGKVDLALYSSATPRTGSRDFVELLGRAVPNRWHLTNRLDIIPTLPPAVSPILGGPNRGKTALYADFDRVVLFDVQGGSLLHNHLPMTYVCGVAGRPAGDAACLNVAWSSAPQALQLSPTDP